MAEVEEMIDYIVPTFNSAATLATCLKSIRRFGEPNSIIIIDNNSTDDTEKIAKSQGCDFYKVVSGIGRARYMGAKLATATRIAFVDSDVELKASWQKVLGSDAPIVSGWYEAFHRPLPHVVTGAAGFIACSILDRQLILDCVDMQSWDYGEDSRFARWYSKPWLILDAECIHHRKDTSDRWRKYGASKRQIDGFSLTDLKRIIGGAAIGYYMGSATNYFKNIWVRFHYLRGYLG
jgi:glycosyltransferase involved in cell wall biosynthesis